MKKVTSVLLVLFAGVCFLTGCATSMRPSGTSALKKEIEGIFVVWGRAALDGDVETFTSLWEDECVKMADHGPTIRGGEMMVAVYEQRMKARKLDTFYVKVDEVVDLGDFCWAMGTYLIEVAPPEGTKEGVTLEGTYLTIFKRQADGSLKVFRDTMMNGTSELI